MTRIVLDFETHDPYLLKYGCGINLLSSPGDNFEVIGCSMKIDEEPTIWVEDMQEVLALCSQHTELVAFNGMYDFSILAGYGLDLRKFQLYDVLLLAKLHNNELMSYHLDDLVKKYLGKHKAQDPMIVEYYAGEERGPKESDVFNLLIEQQPIPLSLKLVYNKMARTTKCNMRALYQKNRAIVREYGIYDTDLTYDLEKYLLEKNDVAVAQYKFWGDILRICVNIKKKGIKFNITKALRLDAQMTQALEVSEKNLYSEIEQIRPVLAAYLVTKKGKAAQFNLGSKDQIAIILQALGVKLTKKTKSGKLSVDKLVLEQCPHPFAILLREYNNIKKLRDQYIRQPVWFQTMLFGTCLALLPQFGRVYTELIPLGAAKTGRFSNRNPNLQQIPSRDKIWANKIKDLYEPDDGKKFYSLDFSSQEPRIGIHLADLHKCTGAESFVCEYRAKPDTSYHALTAELMSVPKEIAKPIGLGLWYGEGALKLSLQHGWGLEETKDLVKQYHDAVPMIRQLTKIYKEQMEKQKFVTTLDGRKLIRPPMIKKLNKYGVEEDVHPDHIGLNRMIQGSAAGQTAIAMWILDKIGVEIVLAIHDELIIQSKCYEDALITKHIMENAYKLVIPSLTEIKDGRSWGECKE